MELQAADGAGLQAVGATSEPTVQPVGVVPVAGGHAGLPLTVMAGAGDPVVPQAMPVTLHEPLRVTMGPTRVQAR
ncbi:MAG: hypothetical protein ABI777_11990, partial [Betaproteobacteria bacterium]